MTGFEITYRCVEPFLPALYGQVRSRLRRIARTFPRPPEILDVGGRKSHYTVGVRGRVTITDLPRVSDVQHRLHLGITPSIARQTLRRRSNIAAVVVDDMTCSSQPTASVDCVVAVEVLEHVAEDRRFIREVARVLRPGGVFLMTTPNGEFIPNTNPDHCRHYTRSQLHDLLCEAFAEVQVDYAVRAGRLADWGRWSFSARRPLRTLVAAAGNLVNGMLSARAAVKRQSQGTCHLIALAAKPGASSPPRAGEPDAETVQPWSW
jgi:SAM-dependent methyltransferase